MNFALYVMSFLPITIFIIGGLILLSSGREIFSGVDLGSFGLLGRAAGTVLWVGLLALIYLVPSFIVALSNLLVYILYNNNFMAGTGDANQTDLGFPSLVYYLDLIGQKISRYIDLADEHRYQSMPLKEKYNNKSLILS